MGKHSDRWSKSAKSYGVNVKQRELKDEQKVRRARRAPKSKRRSADLLLPKGAVPARSDTAFADADMQRLYHRGYFDEFVGLVKGGKEATVYLVKRGEEHLAAKVYADLASRSFRNDAVYWSGVHLADERIAKALKQKSRAGQIAQIQFWVLREYVNLWRLHEAGLPVPKPALGPEVSVCAEAGSIVLMEFIGHGDQPAPRLADVRLAPDEAQEAFRQSSDILVRLAKMGLVHGDYSTYNLLWHDGKVIMIDVPQLVELKDSPEALQLLKRDVTSLLTSFRRVGVTDDGVELRRALADVKLPSETRPA